MKVSGWYSTPNFRTGGGFGIRLSRRDRDRFFRRSWPEVTVILENGEELRLPLTPCFWRRCVELRSAAIGRWLLEQGLAPWPEGHPPQLELEALAGRRFQLVREPRLPGM